MHRLSELNADSFEADHTLALADDEPLCWSRFVADISANRARLTDCPGWALFHNNCYQFAVALCALLAEGKQVYLPADNHAALAADLETQNLKLIGEFAGATGEQIVRGSEGASADPNFHLHGNIVIYTSGSTGTPKPIKKNLAQLDAELLTLESLWAENWRSAVIASTVSHQHLYGLLFALLWPLCSGRSFFHKPFLDPSIMARATASHSQAVWVMSPAHLHRLPSVEGWSVAGSNLTAIFSSGGPLKRAAALQFAELFGRYPVEVYGSSETGGIAWREQLLPEASWQPLPGVEVSTSKRGTLTVHSPWLEDDNWFETEDLVTLTEDNGARFELGMRADRIVKLEGKRVALPQTEAALQDHSWVAEAAALVVTREKRQVLGAVVVLSEAGIAAEHSLAKRQFFQTLEVALRQQLSSIAVPRLWRRQDSLPRNAQGKISSLALSALFKKPPLPKILNRERSDHAYHLTLEITADNPYFNGHFPEQAILPGVVQLIWVQQFARDELGLKGNFCGMKSIKFRELVFPNTTLRLSLQCTLGSGELHFHYDSQAGRHSQGILQFEADA